VSHPLRAGVSHAPGASDVTRVTICGFLESAGRRVEIRLSRASRALKDSLGSRGMVVDEGAGYLTLSVDGQEAVDDILRISNAAGARLEAMIPERQSLESLFLKGASP